MDERWRLLEEYTAAWPNSLSGRSDSLSDLQSFLSAFREPLGLIPRGTQSLTFCPEDFALRKQLGIGEGTGLLGYRLLEDKRVPRDFVLCRGRGERFLACVRFRER